MKTLNVTWDGIQDPTGYLFSFAKSLSCAVKHSPWPEYAEDIVATSGFAFRMWVTRIYARPPPASGSSGCRSPGWKTAGSPPSMSSGCGGWKPNREEARRREAVETVKRSIDRGIPAVSWDIRGAGMGPDYRL